MSWAGNVRASVISLGVRERTRPMRRCLRSENDGVGEEEGAWVPGVAGGACSTLSLTGPPGAMSVTSI